VPVVMILRVKADPNALERFATAHAALMEGVSGAGQAVGATRHTFAAGDGEVLVIDEWPDEATFQKFFESRAEIPRIMQEAGAQGPPEITFYRKLDVPGQF
jgi:quinol monooxygenase YgiN